MWYKATARLFSMCDEDAVTEDTGVGVTLCTCSDFQI